MPLSASTHAAIGAVSGVIEVTLLHPTVAWKNALQEGRPLVLAPKALYRGYLINVGSFAPITCVQFGVNRMLESALSTAGDGAASTRRTGAHVRTNPERRLLRARQAPTSAARSTWRSQPAPAWRHRWRPRPAS